MSKTIPNPHLLKLPKFVNFIDYGEVASLTTIPTPNENNKNTSYIGFKRYKNHDVVRISTITHHIDLVTKKGVRAHQIEISTLESLLVPDHIKKEGGG